MRTRNFLRSCLHGPVGRASVYLLGAIFSAGLAYSLTSYAVHDIGVFELDNHSTGANAIDQSTINDPTPSPDDWAQNNFPNSLNNCPAGLNSCGYVAGPNVDPANPGGSAFRSLFIQDPNGVTSLDTIYTGGGSKDDLDVNQWLTTKGSVPDKNDLLPVGAAAYLVDDELLIYMFGSLFAPNGDAAIGAWLFKKNIGICDDGINANDSDPFGVVGTNGTCLTSQPLNLHSIGDVFIVAQNSNGGRNVAMQVYKWVDENDAQGNDTAAATAAKAACVPPSGQTLPHLAPPLDNLCQVLDDATATCDGSFTGDDACGTMNVGAVRKGDPDFPTESPDDWGFQSKFPPPSGPALPAGTDGIGNDDFPGTSLFEAGLNFSKLFPNEVGCFNSFLMDTRASTSVRAVLKDLALGSFPLCGISVVKTGPEKSKVGDDVTYTYTITNTGAITLYLDTVVDDVVGDLEAAAVAAGCGTLAPQASCTFTAVYKVKATDPDPLINTVIVHYNSSAQLTGDDQTSTDDHTVNLFQPSVTIDKTGDTLSKVGDPVNYTVTVNNTSSTDTPDMVCTISDPLVGINKTVTLVSGANDVTHATYTVQASDPDPLVNTASVSCSPTGFPNVLTASDSHSVELFQPSVSLVKTGDELSKAGDDVHYVITVNNTSSADSPALSCTLTDALLGISKPLNLASGASDVTNATYTVLASDPDPLVNTASITCSPDGFPNVLTASDDHSVNLFQPSISLAKNGDELSKVGDGVNYTITLTNTSSADSPALNCTITDALLGFSKQVTLVSGANDVSNVPFTVPPGAADPLPNTALASCSPQGFPNVLPASASHNVNLFQPSVTIDKTANCELGVAVGADITYTYLITNTGSADSPALNLASIIDDKLGSLAVEASLAGCDSLASGASCQFSKIRSTSGLPVGPEVNTVNVLYNPAGFPNEIRASDVQSCEIIQPEPATVVIEKVLLGGENFAFNYTDSNLTVPGAPGSFALTPLFTPVPAQNALSPFAAVVGPPDGFATTTELTVAIPNINQTVQSSVTEVLPLSSGLEFVDLVCAPATGGSLTGSQVSGTTATLTLGSGDFAFCRYTNKVVVSAQGCTPGFWKQDQHFQFWPQPYDPTDKLNTVFSFVGVNGQIGPLGNDTLLQALNYQGGTGKLGAAKILLRAAVAAVLNAASVDYPFSVAQVIADVNYQLLNGTRATMLELATTLDNANNGVLIDNGGTEDCPFPPPQ